MKILILCNSASGLLMFRGRLIEKIVELENEVEAIIPLSEDADERLAKIQLDSIGCQCIYVSMDRRGVNPFSDIKLFGDFKKVLKKAKPDLVITYTIKPNVYGGMACRLLNIPYAMNITGLGTAFENDGFVEKIVCLLYKIASGSFILIKSLQSKSL